MSRMAQPITMVLIVVYGLVMLLEALSSAMPFNLALIEPSISVLEKLGGNVYADVVNLGQWWRLLTATLLHGGITHLGFNALATWNIGRPLEIRAGWRGLLSTFAITGTVASLSSILFNARESIGIGASGAIMGMLGFLVVSGVVTFAQFVSQIQRNAIMLLVVIGSSAIIPGVDNVAHVGGLMAGLLLGFVWERLPGFGKTFLGSLSTLALLAAFGLILLRSMSNPV